MVFFNWLAGKFRGADLPEDKYLADIKTGKRLETLVQNGSLDVLWEEILEPMDREAFELFKTIDPSDFNAVNQAQKISAVVHDIRKRVHRKIEDGLRAQQTLKALAEEQ